MGVPLLLCILTAEVLLGGLVSADLFTPEQERSLNSFVDEIMQCSHLPALSLSVVKDDQVFIKAYGLSDLEKQEPTTPDTLFCLASVSKAFTPALLSKLLPQKYPKTVWDTKVKDILGKSFRLPTDELTEQVTVRDILSHRTGLSASNLGWFAGYSDSVSRADIIRKLRYLPVTEPFRYVYHYNNWMYALGGYIAEVLAGDGSSFEDLMEEHIFKPLGMNSTVINSNGLQTLIESRKVALPYIYKDGNYSKMAYEIARLQPVEPAGGICSTGRDMTSWLRFLLQAPGAPLLEDVTNPAAFRQTMEPVMLNTYYLITALTVPTYPVDLAKPAYGLGWYVGSYRGRHYVSHDGYLFAYTSNLWLFPERKIGVFVNSNGYLAADNHVKDLLLSYISDVLFGETPWVNSTTACSFPRPWKQPFVVPNVTIPRAPAQRPLADYTGVYGHRLMGDITITVADSDNTLKLAMGNFQAFLYPTDKKDEFSSKITGPFDFMSTFGKLNFQFQNGKADGIVIDTLTDGILEFKKNVRFSDKDPAKPTGGSPILRPFRNLLLILLAGITVRNIV